MLQENIEGGREKEGKKKKTRLQLEYSLPSKPMAQLKPPGVYSSCSSQLEATRLGKLCSAIQATFPKALYWNGMWVQGCEGAGRVRAA